MDINLINQKVLFLDNAQDWYNKKKRICRFTRIAYRTKNSGKTDEEKDNRDDYLVKDILIHGNDTNRPQHTSTFEHENFGVIITTSRGIANEFTRHRHTAFTQESTRYVNFNKKEASFILPLNCNDASKDVLIKSYESSLQSYYDMIKNGTAPQIARDSLPLGLGTVLGMSTNIAEWRSIFKLRCDSGAHMQARQVAFTILKKFHEMWSAPFEDLWLKFKDENIPECEIEIDS